MPSITVLIIVFVSIIAGLGIFIIGWITANKVNHARMTNVETYAKKITEEAEREADTIRKAAALDSKDEWFKERAKFEKETRDTRQEIERLEQALHDRERKLDKKVDILNVKERNILLKERRSRRRKRRSV